MGFTEEAKLVREALLKAILHFKSPIELFVYDKRYFDYLSESGQASCKTQAWSAAAVLSSVSAYRIPQTANSAHSLTYIINPKGLSDLVRGLFKQPLTVWEIPKLKSLPKQAAVTVNRLSKKSASVLKELESKLPKVKSKG